MPDLFGLDIAGMVNDAIVGAGGLPALTLIKVTPGTRTSGNLTGGTNPTEVPHAGNGFEAPLSSLRPDTVAAEATGVVVILGASLPSGIEPKATDKVAFEGAASRIVRVERDPAAATYICQIV